MRRLSFTAPFFWVILGSLILAAGTTLGGAQQPVPSTAPYHSPTLQVNSRLVFLDVTVLDSKGHAVTQGLTKEDFIITEGRKPQRIFSFEPPEVHVADVENSQAEPPVTIFVLDQLNSTFEQMAYIRYQVHMYLARQPDLLDSPAEVLLLVST